MKSTRSRLLTVVAMTASIGLTACAAPGSGNTAGGEDNSDSSAAAAAECSDVKLRLSHQWPEPTGEEGGDFRSLIANKFAEEVSTATDGQVTVTVYPNSTLAKATEQYDAMMSGSIDASVFPLDYASGKVPEWSITLMPALVRNHDEAKAWDEGEIGAAVHENMKENGLIALTDVWNAGAIGVKGDPVLRPDDISGGETMRAAGTYVEHMLEAAGAGITSLPSSEIYTAMQTGVLDAAVTSTGSFASYNLQEQVKSFTSPTTHTFWFMYEPLVITTSSFAKLCADQQDAVLQAGKDLQDYSYTASREDDTRVEKIFQDAGVEVVTMSDEDFDSWLPLAEEQWKSFAESVDGGQELLDLAKQIREG